MSKMSDIQVQIQEVETVSKQAVIDAFKVWLIDNNDMRRFEEVVRDMQPFEQIQTCDDAVSRQDIYNELEKWDWQELYLPIHFKENIVDVLPPVTPTRPKGHWVYKEGIYGVSFCDRCDFELTINDTNFCPNCGADMREGEA